MTIDKQNDGMLNVQYHTGKENSGDYVTKYHPQSHHQKSYSMYISIINFLTYLQYSLQPHVMQEYVYNLNFSLNSSSNPRPIFNPQVSINIAQYLIGITYVPNYVRVYTSNANELLSITNTLISNTLNYH